MSRLVALLILVALSAIASATTLEHAPVQATPVGLSAATLAVVVNTADPYSVAVSAYYQQRRHIPEQNMIRVRFAAERNVLSATEFAAIAAEVTAKTPLNVQGYALSWVQPYRVECMSITTALAFGFDPAFCTHECGVTRKSPYFDSSTRIPADSFGVRPTMSIAASSIAQAKALIDRGVAADSSNPHGTAYLVVTDDPIRNARTKFYSDVARTVRGAIRAAVVETNALTQRDDIMFYFIGERSVSGIETNKFLPGAIADHLTSTGGDLLATRQMSSLRWIDAGATGSYGSVAEPCALTDKFPNPAIVLKFYQQGDTLLEAYWKSVAMPGQGIFIGEPLARPFAPSPSKPAQSAIQ